METLEFSQTTCRKRDFDLPQLQAAGVDLLQEAHTCSLEQRPASDSGVCE